MVAQKQKKKINRELTNLANEYSNLNIDLLKYEELKRLQIELEKNGSFKLNAVNYIQTNIDAILSILKDNHFVENDFKLTEKGIVAMQLQEVHALALADLYNENNGLRDLSVGQIASLFSCFTNISIPNDKQLQSAMCQDEKIKKMTKTLGNYINKYYDLETDYQLNTGTDYTLHFELIDYIQEWCLAEDEISCRNIIINIKEEKEIFLGEFVKAILKINNIAKEFEKICEAVENIDLLQKIKQIPEITLKYVATNQSLYI